VFLLEMRQHKRPSPLMGILAFRGTDSRFDPVGQVFIRLVIISSDHYILPHPSASDSRFEVHFRAIKHGS